MSLRRSSLWYTLVKITSLGLMLIINLSLPEFISDESYALFGSSTAIFAFVMLFNWGVPTLLEKELSMDSEYDVAALRFNYNIILIFTLMVVFILLINVLNFPFHLMMFIVITAWINLNGIFSVVFLRRKGSLVRILLYLLIIPFVFLCLSFILYPNERK